MYNLDLDLKPEQSKQLKQLALDRNTSIRGLVTKLVLDEIERSKKQATKKQ